MVFCDFYLPGYKSGGGMWTVVNIVKRFSSKYDFFIVTRNYDSVGDTKPYDTVKTGEWNALGNEQVYYFSKGKLPARKAADLVNDVSPDLVFLNSAFSQPVIRYLTARAKHMIAAIPTILAPCGELSKGALGVKPIKKKLYLKYASLAGLYRGLIWKASSDAERDEISSVFGFAEKIAIAPDLVPREILPGYDQRQKPFKQKGSVRFVFMSRIVPKKNLHFFLECLREVREGQITFDVIGPVEDHRYWERCSTIIAALGPNITVNVVGPLSQGEALDRVFSSHIFAMPSLNENFGYVFIESLAAGCPLLISDQTMWGDIEARNAGWAIPLGRKDLYVQRIKDCVDMDDAEFRGMSATARSLALEWLADPATDNATASLFEESLTTGSAATKSNG